MPVIVHVMTGPLSRLVCRIHIPTMISFTRSVEYMSVALGEDHDVKFLHGNWLLFSFFSRTVDWI
jgi:hypothetical protein